MKALMSIVLTLPILAQCQATADVRSDGRTMWIENTPLEESGIRAVEALFSKHWNLDEIRLRNVKGDDARADKYLFSKFVHKRIVVSGRCESMCATLALSGDPVLLEKDALLVIHSSRTPFDGDLDVDFASRNQAWLPARLPTVPKEAIATALKALPSSDRGMFIYPEQDGSGRIAVALCESYPTRCTAVTHLAEGDSRLRLAALPAKQLK